MVGSGLWRRVGGVLVVVGGPGVLAACEAPRGEERALAAASSSMLEVRLSEQASRAVGTPMAITVDYRNAPAGAGLVLELARDVEPGSEVSYQGATGPIITRAIAVSGRGREVVRWNGADVACAPTDAPTQCPVEIGRYRIAAVLLDRGDVGLVGRPMGKRPRILGQSHSVAFSLTGEPDLTNVESRLWGAATRHFRDWAGTIPHQWSDNKPLRQTTRVGELERRGGRYCARYRPAAPVRGQLTACTTENPISPEGVRLPEKMEVTGRLTWQPGVVPFQEAKTIAQELAGRPYRGRVDTVGEMFPLGADHPAHGPRHMANDVQRSVYRPDFKAWLIVVNALGMTERPGHLFADRVIVRVADDGRACRVATVPYHPNTWIDLERGAHACASR